MRFKKHSHKIAIHFDIYSSKLDYNLIFYELFYLSFLNDNSKTFLEIPTDISFFIEVENTFKNALFQSLLKNVYGH